MPSRATSIRGPDGPASTAPPPHPLPTIPDGEHAGEDEGAPAAGAYLSAIVFSRARASAHSFSKFSFSAAWMSISIVSSVPPLLSAKV